MKILIVKIGAIGDVVMCLPLVRHIKTKNPNARITWLCGKVVAPFLRCFPEIDELIIADEGKLLNGSIFDKILEVSRIWKCFFLRSFHLTLYFYYSDLYKVLIFPSRKGQTRRFNKNPKFRIAPVPARHHTFAYLSTFDSESGPLEYVVEYPNFRPKSGYLDKIKFQIPAKKSIAISCGGAKNFLRSDDLRRWPIEFYVEIAASLANQGFTVVLTGAKSDHWVLEHFQKVQVVDFIGKVDLPEFVGLLSLCRLLITHDSGPLHLADIAGIPSLGLFGPTNPGDFRSLHPDSDFLWGGKTLSCRPCYDGKSYAPCKSNLCMQSIGPEMVLSKLTQMGVLS